MTPTFALCLLSCCVWVKGQDFVQVILVDPIPPGDSYLITSDEFTYPSESTDVLWQFAHDIEVKVRKLRIDGQSGDFFLFSREPYRNVSEGDMEIDTFLENFPVDPAILLSWEHDPSAVVQLLNEDGVSIYFHGNSTRVLDNLGFVLEVSRFLRNPFPDVSTTTELPQTAPPGQTEDDFVTKYVTGKTPTEFFLELDLFRQILADMTDAYCEDKGIPRPNLTHPSNIDIPEDQVRFCSRSWPLFKECVEVTFAIVTYDLTGDYVMTGDRLDEMWDTLGHMLGDIGLSPYTPSVMPPRTVGWAWVVSSLITVAAVCLFLSLTWLKKANDKLSRDAALTQAMAEATDEDKFYDRDNPIHQIRKTMFNGKGRGEESDSGKGSWEKIKGQEVISSGFYLPSLDGSDSSVYRVNKMYIPDEDEDEEEYFDREKGSGRRPDSDWPRNQRSPLHRQNFGFDYDEDLNY